MNTIYNTVIMMRGITGSGKSTVSKVLNALYTKEGKRISVHSTDDYFVNKEGLYDFDGSKLSEYHQKNLETFTKSLATNTQILICDNTNLAPWQTKAYTQAARAHGYKIIFVDFALRTLQEHLLAQEVTLENPTAHAIPKEAILKMVHDYECNTDFLEQRADVESREEYFDLDVCIKVAAMSKEEMIKHVQMEIRKNITKEER